MSDSIITQHPRFPAFTRDVISRSGHKPSITAPLFKDEQTNMQVALPSEQKAGEAHLDSFAFGMGLCCLQVTFGCIDMEESRWLYDQFHMFTPIFVSC